MRITKNSESSFFYGLLSRQFSKTEKKATRLASFHFKIWVSYSTCTLVSPGSYKSNLNAVGKIPFHCPKPCCRILLIPFTHIRIINGRRGWLQLHHWLACKKVYVCFESSTAAEFCVPCVTQVSGLSAALGREVPISTIEFNLDK